MPWFVTQYLKSLGDNLHRVTPRIWRSAELSATRLVQVRQQYGIQAMLNLRDDLPDEEIAEIKAAGLQLFWVPMKDDAAPTREQVMSALGVLQQLGPTLICCKGGRHRTGLIYAVYRVVVQFWTKRDAWAEAEKYGWYDRGGHKPLRQWFEQFDPAEYR